MVALPWYEQDDYHQLKQMNKGGTLPATYDEWRAEMLRTTKRASAQGIVVLGVTVRVDEYFAWLESQCRPDTAEARSSYFAQLAKAVGEAALEARERVSFPTRH